MPSRRAVGLLLLAAFVLRLASNGWLTDPAPQLAGDALWYHASAVSLAAGEGYVHYFTRQPTAAWPPGYPLMLAGLYLMVGPSILAAKLLNVALAAGSVLLTYLIACELRRPVAGLLAAAILAVFPGWVLFAPLVLSEALFVFLFCLVLWLFVRWDARGGAGPGAWLGLGAFLGAIGIMAVLVILPAWVPVTLMLGGAWLLARAWSRRRSADARRGA